MRTPGKDPRVLDHVGYAFNRSPLFLLVTIGSLQLLTGVVLIMAQTKNPRSDVLVSDPPARDGPGPVVTAIGILMALWCLGFAVVNVMFEITGHFAGGAYAQYASGLSVMDWLVAGLKVLGAVVALLSVARRPRLVSSDVVTVLCGQHSPRSRCMCWAAWSKPPAWARD